MRNLASIRIVFGIALLLGIGGAISTAVAWGATFLVLSQPGFRGTSSSLNTLQITRAVRLHPAYAVADEADPTALRWTWYPMGDLPDWSTLHDVPAEHPAHLMEVAAGWPLPALRYELLGTKAYDIGFWSPRRGALYGSLGASGIPEPLRAVTHLPVRLIGLNFALDSLFWGALVMLLLCARPLLRVNRWLRRVLLERCFFCGYDKRHDPSGRCPECGRTPVERPVLLTKVSGAMALLLLIGLVAGEVAFSRRFTAHRISEPIHAMAMLGDAEGVRAELARGVSPDLQILDLEYKGSTLLKLTVAKGHLEVLELLLKAGANPDLADRLGETPLTDAIQYQEHDMIRALLDAGADPNTVDAVGRAPLDFATRGKPWFREDINRLLDAGADPNGGPSAFWQGPLVFAIVSGEDELIERLLDEGAAVTLDVLTLAQLCGREDLLQRFTADFDVFTQIDVDGRTAFFYQYVWDRDRAFWTKLIEHGVDVNTIDRSGFTALMMAASDNRLDLARFLLEQGADPTPENAYGLTAQDLAIDPALADELKAAVEEWNEGQPAASEPDSGGD